MKNKRHPPPPSLPLLSLTFFIIAFHITQSTFASHQWGVFSYAKFRTLAKFENDLQQAQRGFSFSWEKIAKKVMGKI